MINLNSYQGNIYSQYGEDFVIKFLLDQIQRTDFVIEFGAADGYFFSNTARLWKAGSRALLIESDQGLAQKLKINTEDYPNVTAVQGEVKNIDDYTTEIADVCSIDVDGDDYHIAERMKTPHNIVVVEYNPTAPPHVHMIGIEGTQYGSSAASINKLMASKGYTLVAATKTNLIFLYGEHHNQFESRLEVLFDYSSLNYIITSYDGLYDTIGEFGYGYNKPVNMRLFGRPTDISKTVDSTTQEYIRQISALMEGKESR